MAKSDIDRCIKSRLLHVSGKAELDTLAIQDLLEAHGFLSSIWSVEDVQSVRPDLTDEQCRKVLRECSRRQGAEAGINWGVISAVADDLFPPSGE